MGNIKKEFEIKDEELKENLFATSENEADAFTFNSEYVESEEEKEEIAHYQKLMRERFKKNRPKKIIQWKPKGVILLEIIYFILKFSFIFWSIATIEYNIRGYDINFITFINTFTLTTILYLFKQWWKS